MQPNPRLVALAVLAVLPALAAAQSKPPVAQYWMDVGTNSMNIPGMGGGGLGGAILGAMVPGMGGGPQKSLNLYLHSRQPKPASPEATHDIPAGLDMGPTLPLVLPRVERASRPEERDTPEKLEKPRARILFYWGCGEAVRPGQPRVADTEKMSMVEFAKVFAGRTPPDRGSPWGPDRAVWPNEKDSRAVPERGSLLGDHLVKGNYTPDIRFRIGERQDFLAPMAVSAAGELSQPVQLDWREVPNALGYFHFAMANRQSTGEMILWSSSEVPDSGFGLLGYLPNDFVRRMIQEKVVLPPTATRCAIPKGIFEGTEGAMLQSIAYGEELNLAHPPRPADPKAPWEPVWFARVRVKSTGMTMLGMGAEASAARGSSSRAASPGTPPAPGGAPAGQTSDSPVDQVKDAVDKVRGLFRW
ncbi:MAG: hypothetical protein N2544_01110 [Burkholderiales bacterium]|nr:hypothetical protein [Burkholderiales bacterium]